MKVLFLNVILSINMKSIMEKMKPCYILNICMDYVHADGPYFLIVDKTNFLLMSCIRNKVL